MEIQQEPVHFTAASVIEDDYVCIATRPDALDEDDEFTRLFF